MTDSISIVGGEAGGTALADVLFGAYNPTGKLAATMYPPEYVDQIALTEMGLTVGPGRTHMFYTGTPEFAFGSGLSYTQWQLAWAEQGSAPSNAVWSLTEDSSAHTIQVQLHNSGSRHGAQTVLLFWRLKSGGMKMQQKLVGYQGTTGEMSPGEKQVLQFEIEHSMLEVTMEDGSSVLALGEYELYATAGADELSLTQVINVVA